MLSPSTLPVVGPLIRRLTRAIEWRIDEKVHALSIATHESARATDDRLDAVLTRIDHLESQVGSIEHRLGEDVGFLVHQVSVLAPQVAALEVRVEDLRERNPTIIDHKGDPELTAARTEHARVRVRLTAVSQYEERLRRLEKMAARSPDDTVAVTE